MAVTLTSRVSAGDMVGTTTNDAAQTGTIGEQIISTVASAAAVGLTTATPANVTSISLTPGDWEVSGVVVHKLGATTSVTILQAGISTTSATLPTVTGGTTDYAVWRQAAAVPAGDISQVVGPVRISLAATTTVFLVANDTFTVSTDAAYGTLRARRVR